MNKNVHILGLITIISMLFMGCTNAKVDLDASKDTGAIEKANPLEEKYEMKIDDVMEITQDYGVFQADNTTPYEELITKTVDIHEFAQNFGLLASGRGIKDVMEFIGVECLRETETSIYSVHKVEQGGLLYIFYHKEPWRTEITTNGILYWYYVRERLSSSDFDHLEENVTTIEEAIEFNEVEQIFLNCYEADPAFQYEPQHLYIENYLTDGLLGIKYNLVDGKLVFSESIFVEDYDMSQYTGARAYPYEARILDMDWVE